MYANPNAELYAVPAAGGTAIRLAANNPPACSGRASPGVNNHWARWSPDVATVQGARYYWLMFSSNRADLPPGTSTTGRAITISQLYLAPFVVDDSLGVRTYPAIYLWSQPTSSVNTTPSWETLSMAPAP